MIWSILTVAGGILLALFALVALVNAAESGSGTKQAAPAEWPPKGWEPPDNRSPWQRRKDDEAIRILRRDGRPR